MTCWTPFSTSRTRATDVQQSLDAKHILAAALEQHRQPDPERDPVELLVEEEAVSLHVASVHVLGRQGRDRPKVCP